MIVVQGRVLVTDHWPDLAQAPQPIFHRDELARLAGAQATPERYEDVAYAKRLFRGMWVVAASRPRRPRRKKRERIRILGRGLIESSWVDDD